TRLQNRLRWHIHELDPEFHIRRRGLRAMSQLDRVAALLATLDGLVAELASDLVERCRELNRKINDLERRLRPLVRQLGPSLSTVHGCVILSDAEILDGSAGDDLFHAPATFARFNGAAPIPVWSSNTERFRLDRGGNRQISHALHMLTDTQLRGVGPRKA